MQPVLTIETKFQVLIKYFMDQFSLEMLLDQRQPKDWEESRAKFYFERLLDFQSSIEKIEKYEIYFSEFYPASNNISTSEAIEHHWHSYLQDFYILEERFLKIINSLKNDLPRYRIANPEVAKLLLSHLKKQIQKGFKEAHEVRNEHTHKSTIRNFDLSRGKTLQLLKQHCQVLGLDPVKIEDKIKGIGEEAKEEFIKMAVKNKEGMIGLKDFFAPRFGHLFASLNGHDYSIFKMD